MLGSKTYHQVETEGVIKSLVTSCGNDTLFDIEASRCQDDCEGNPEPAIGGECGSTEGVANSHFPIVTC